MSVLVKSTAEKILCLAAEQLGLTAEHPDVSTLVTAALRRLAGFQCPCQHATLRDGLLSSLGPLVKDPNELKNTIKSAIEQLLVSGDLLELSHIPEFSNNDYRGWLFVRPPSFVKRTSGMIFILGIGPDDAAFLPRSILERLNTTKSIRYIDSAEDEYLSDTLKGLGLREVSEQSWFSCPAPESAEAHLQNVRLRLAREGRCGEIPGLSILLSPDTANAYRQRWANPTGHTGIFVARRPQTYGAPLWGVAELENGAPVKFINLPYNESPWRACDIAWRIQLAKDAENGTPGVCTRKNTEEGCLLHFSFPIPLWAQRRLSVVGTSQEGAGGEPFSFLISDQEVEAESIFLRDHLWLSMVDSTNSARRN